MEIEVSAIIPTYNEETCIDECLQSICNQTHHSYEVIVVDDGSTDKTVERSRQHPTTLLLQKHQGPAVARNFGAQHSTGKILVFLDADMTFEPNFLEKLVQPILEKKTVGTFTKEEYVANVDNKWANCWTQNDHLPPGHRIFPEAPDECEVFRAILREEFFIAGGYDNLGYFDDHSISKKLGKKATAAAGAICYHNNPGTLKEVFSSAKWIGKGEFKKDVAAFRRHDLLASLRSGMRISRQNSDYHFLIFKVIYDLGMSTGMLRRLLSPQQHTK